MNRIDDHLGTVIFTDAVPHQPDHLDYFITPAGERHRRPLGRLIKSRGILVVERDGSAPVHIRHDGYHINQHVLHSMPGGPEMFTKLALVEVDTQKAYLMEVTHIILESQPQRIQREGLAAQVFLFKDWVHHYPAPPNQELLDDVMKASPTMSRAK